MLKKGNPIKNEKFCDDRMWVKFVKPIGSLFYLVGKKRGSRNRQNVFIFFQGTTMTHTSLQVRQNIFDLVVTEISARVKITIQSLAAAGNRAYRS